MSTIQTPITKSTKLSNLINYRLRIISKDTQNNRNYVGTLLAFDNHLNLVLSDVEEIRLTKKSIQSLKLHQNDHNDHNNGDTTTTITNNNNKANVIYDKRSLGLIILRGEQIVSVSIESPPAKDLKSRLGLNSGNSKQLKKGKGVLKPLKTPVSVKSKVSPANKLKGPTLK